MPQRTRYIRPEFFTSPDTAKASPKARLLYAAMWCWTDDQGVGETNLYGLLGHAFPESDGVSAAELLELLSETATCWGVDFYSIGGRNYFHIPSWTTHQTADKRTVKRHPLPDHPEALPDKRFPQLHDVAMESHGNPVGSSGFRMKVESGNEKGEMGTPLPPHAETAPPHTPAKPGGAELARRRFQAIPSHSLTAFKIAKAYNDSLPTPVESGTLNEIAVEIDKCLKAEIDPSAIAAGITAWTQSSSWAPSQIPKFVHKTNNHGAGRSGVGKPTSAALDYEAAAEELLAQVAGR